MKLRTITLLPLLLLAATAFAANGAVELVSLAEIEHVVKNADGSVTIQRQPASKVVPGDEVIYTMRYRNTGADPADDVVITNPLPEHMLLLRTDALPAGMTLTFSVDGGLAFDALSRLSVTDIHGRLRPATAADCTHLRWEFEYALDPGEAGAIGYVAQLQ